MSIKVKLPTEWFDAEKDLFDIKSSIIYKDVPRILAAEQAKGFPEDEDSYQVFLKNRGSTSRRQLSTIKPQYLRIPFSLRFVAFGNMEDVVQAVLFAYQQARARAPSRSGSYKGSIVIGSDNGTSINASPDSMDPRTVFYVAAGEVYSAIIEWGFYSGYYKTGSRPDGIMYHAAKLTERKFGNAVAIQYKYPGGTPAIFIAAAGVIAESFRRPGTDRRRAKKRRGKGIKTRRSSSKRF